MYEKPMGAWEAYKHYWKNGVTFQGRARRKEYWMPTLINGIISTVFLLIMIGLFTVSATNDQLWTSSLTTVAFLYILLLLFGLANLLPSLAVTVRRFHDIGKSGWWVLIPFVVPVILSFISMYSSIMMTSSADNVGNGTLYFTAIPLITTLISLGISIWMIVLLAKNSKPETNQWGMNPKDPDSPDVPMNKYHYEYEARNEREYK